MYAVTLPINKRQTQTGPRLALRLIVGVNAFICRIAADCGGGFERSSPDLTRPHHFPI
jgi:hypothetical protein